MILGCGTLCCAAVGAVAPKQVARAASMEATANSVLFIGSFPKASAVQRRKSSARMDLPEMYSGWLIMQKWALGPFRAIRDETSSSSRHVGYALPKAEMKSGQGIGVCHDRPVWVDAVARRVTQAPKLGPSAMS